WYHKAAEGGYHWGYYNVGRCYMEGKGVAKNPDEARKWFRQAAQLGNPIAHDRLRELGDL
ncbi:MAG: sel1 repeat family protein, partial [Akkermansia sp.]|nr:sel1 repeat family protein [Akkermansia sp.]